MTTFPAAPIPSGTVTFVWSMLVPLVPVMAIGQVLLYRMTPRPAPEPTFFG